MQESRTSFELRARQDLHTKIAFYFEGSSDDHSYKKAERCYSLFAGCAHEYLDAANTMMEVNDYEEVVVSAAEVSAAVLPVGDITEDGLLEEIPLLAELAVVVPALAAFCCTAATVDGACRGCAK
jgi:hypothetical protein